jgi:hypothetical protein
LLPAARHPLAATRAPDLPVTPARVAIACRHERCEIESIAVDRPHARAVELFAGSAETARNDCLLVSPVVSPPAPSAYPPDGSSCAPPALAWSGVYLGSGRVPECANPARERLAATGSAHALGLNLRIAHTTAQIGVLSGGELALRPASSPQARKPPTVRTRREAGSGATGCDCGAGPLFDGRRPAARGRFAPSCAIARWA